MKNQKNASKSKPATPSKGPSKPPERRVAPPAPLPAGPLPAPPSPQSLESQSPAVVAAAKKRVVVVPAAQLATDFAMSHNDISVLDAAKAKGAPESTFQAVLGRLKKYPDAANKVAGWLEVNFPKSGEGRGRAAPKIGESRVYKAQQIGDGQVFSRTPLECLGIKKTDKFKITFGSDKITIERAAATAVVTDE